MLKHHIPIKTDSWDVKTPGFTETDLVSHSGNSASGEFLHSLNVTDIHSTWVESRAVMGKSQIGVPNAMQEIEQALPFKLLGIDSDNGSEFINYHLKTFCDQNKIQFTRGRPYKKNDNAHIEQKNYTHVRKIFGYLRYDSQSAQKAMNDLYQNELTILQNLLLPQPKADQPLAEPSSRFKALGAVLYGTDLPPRIIFIASENYRYDAASKVIGSQIHWLSLFGGQPYGGSRRGRTIESQHRRVVDM